MWSAFILVFLSGIVIGVVIGIMVAHSPDQAKNNHKRQKMVKIRILRNMSSRLNLTADQKVQVEMILDNMTKNIASIHADQRPVIKDIIKQSFDKINLILSDDQKEKLRRMYKKISENRKRRISHDRRTRNRFKEKAQHEREMSTKRFRGRREGDSFNERKYRNRQP